MWAAVDEDQLAEAGSTFSSAPVIALRAMAMLGWDTGGPEPAAQRIRAESDPLLFFECFSEVACVVPGELGLVDVQHLLAQALRFGVMRLAAAVAMADAPIAVGPDLGLEPEDLAYAQLQHRSCGSRRESGKRLVDDGEPFHFRLGVERELQHVTSIASLIPIESI